MAKAVFLYKMDDKGFSRTNTLWVKIGDGKTFSITKGKITEVEVSEGVQEIKMYFNCYDDYDVNGLVTDGVTFYPENYFVYKAPLFIRNKGKFYRVDSLEDLNREKRKTKAGYIFGIVMFVITMLISFLVRILR